MCVINEMRGGVCINKMRWWSDMIECVINEVSWFKVGPSLTLIFYFCFDLCANMVNTKYYSKCGTNFYEKMLQQIWDRGSRKYNIKIH